MHRDWAVRIGSDTAASVSNERPRLLDLFCGAGGASRGLQQAGFHVTGVDINPQPHYCGDAFIQADALDVPLEGYDAYWASPPCQFATSLLLPDDRAKYPNHIPTIRQRLRATGKPYIIENVSARVLYIPVMLCGQMFGLRVLRHRWFESNMGLLVPPHERHNGHTSTGDLAAYHTFAKARYITVAGHAFNLPDGRVAMGIDWMTRNELAQAIPPVYAEYIGGALLKAMHRD